MKKPTIIAGIAVAVLLTSCEPPAKSEKEPKSKSKSENSKDGVVKAYYPGGALRAELSMKNGKRNGRAKEYYKGGGLFQEIDYVDDVKHGKALKYYENGKLFQETPYEKGKLHGIQKKYRDDGRLSAEIPYHNDNQCIGIKEYTLDGAVKKQYPSIVVKTTDNTLTENKYSVIISMSEKTKNVEYFLGELDNGSCLHNRLSDIYKVKNGIATIDYNLPPGAMVMETINIVAKVKTVQGNYYITQRKFNVAAEHRRF